MRTVESDIEGIKDLAMCIRESGNNKDAFADISEAIDKITEVLLNMDKRIRTCVVAVGGS